MRDKVYGLGVIIAFLGITGIAEAVTGQGSGTISALFLTAGFVMSLAGYIKK
ncbi:MAG: hypothetical protein K5870_01080 [Lachnospiraceae bacterium]|nr:hypothetical protein [Lachnospiraceae bacterium]